MAFEKVQILERAAQLGGPIPNLTDGDLFKLPRYEEDFVSKRFPGISGKVALRFPSFGDEVEMERLASLWGGTLVARVNAAFVVCLDAAPACWFRPGAGDSVQPVPAVERIPDSPALVALYGRWIAWRDTFRIADEGPAGPGTEQAGTPAVGGGEGA